MKVALIGNMNNNNFSLLRYLRDAGIDAYLLLYTNELEHFTPLSDTWFFEKHKPYIIQTNLENSERGVLFTSKKNIENNFKNYNVFIGSGLTPAYFAKMGKTLDIYYPYGIGIEYYGNKINYLRIANLFKIPARILQKRGLKKTKKCIISNVMEHETVESYKKLSITPIGLNIPMVYNLEILEEKDIPEKLKKIITEFKQYEKIVFSHVTHRWDFEDSGSINHKLYNINRRNDKLIRGFAIYQKNNPKKSLLVLSEYGPDAPKSKALIEELNIQKSVLWLPILGRKELMLLIRHAHICVGELGEAGTWGGSTWEFLAMGKPVINRYKMDEGKYKEMMGIPFPPLINIENENNIADVLLEHDLNLPKYQKIGEESLLWFNHYNGASLIPEFKKLITE